MSKPAPVLAIPPLSAVTDPNARAALQAIAAGIDVRNGARGDGGEKFLTVNDLKEGVKQAAALGTGGALGAVNSDAGGGPGPAAVASMLQNVSDTITSSKLWVQLGERLKHIETPEWFRGKFGAEIKTEQIRQGNLHSALVSKVDTAISNISGNLAIAKQTLTAVSDEVSATASATTDLQVSLYGSPTKDVLAAQQRLSITANKDGTLGGAWTVKFDANGYVVGAGLSIDKLAGSTTPSSAFYIRADRFAIGAPVSTLDVSKSLNPAAGAVPFSVLTAPETRPNGSILPAGVYLNVPLYGVSGYFSGELSAATGTFTGTVNLGTLKATKIIVGSTLIDDISGAQIMAAAASSKSYATQNGLAQITSGEMNFYGPSYHSGPLNQRVQSHTPVTFIVTANAVVDYYLSIWYRVANNNAFGAWQYLADNYDLQSGYGAVSVSGTLVYQVPATGYIQFGAAVLGGPYGAAGAYQPWSTQAGNQDVRGLSISVLAINF